MMISGHASELWNYISPQLEGPVEYLARVHEIIASAAREGTYHKLSAKHLDAYLDELERRF